MTQGEFMLITRWRKGEPQLGLSALGGRVPFETLVQAGSALGTGSDTLRAVYAGTGAAAAYENVTAKGKIVVVERSDEVPPQERTEAAVAAGAKALIVVNDRAGGLMEYVGESAIPVATVHRDAGKSLVAMAKAGIFTLTVKQTEHTPFVYDLTRDYPGQVPDRALVYTPSKAELARIDARYYAAAAWPGRGGLPVRLHPQPVVQLPRARVAPGHPYGVGDPGPGLEGVPHAGRRRTAAVVDGVRRQHVRQGQHHPPGLVRSGDPARSERVVRGVQLPLAELHDLERAGVGLRQRHHAARRLPALG